MNAIMAWDRCLVEYVRKVEPDHEKIKSIVKMCDIRLRVLNDIKIDDETASVVAADYYEVIKELLTALLLKHGLKSLNHECLVSFFKKQFSQYEYEVNIIYQLKNVRNRISYDGIFVEKSYIDSNRLEFEHIIEMLKRLLIE